MTVHYNGYMLMKDQSITPPTVNISIMESLVNLHVGAKVQQKEISTKIRPLENRYLRFFE